LQSLNVRSVKRLNGAITREACSIHDVLSLVMALMAGQQGIDCAEA
jgi:hypothetical protein